jgi:hypothetical protein
MWNVEALRITNKQILKEFNNMPSMENITAKRQLIWIGKFARLPIKGGMDPTPKERRTTTTYPP